MKKKTALRIGIVIVLLILVIVYFWPLQLSKTINEAGEIQMVLTEFNLQLGKPDMNAIEYRNITPDQKQAILSLLEKYTYRRTLRTPFSDGSMDVLGGHLLNIYVFCDISDIDHLGIASNEIAINSKNYHMNNAEQLIAEVIEILE